MILVSAPVPVEPFGFRLGFGTGIGAKAYQYSENKTKYCMTDFNSLNAVLVLYDCSLRVPKVPF